MIETFNFEVFEDDNSLLGDNTKSNILSEELNLVCEYRRRPYYLPNLTHEHLRAALIIKGYTLLDLNTNGFHPNRKGFKCKITAVKIPKARMRVINYLRKIGMDIFDIKQATVLGAFNLEGNQLRGIATPKSSLLYIERVTNRKVIIIKQHERTFNFEALVEIPFKANKNNFVDPVLHEHYMERIVFNEAREHEFTILGVSNLSLAMGVLIAEHYGIKMLNKKRNKYYYNGRLIFAKNQTIPIFLGDGKYSAEIELYIDDNEAIKIYSDVLRDIFKIECFYESKHDPYLWYQRGREGSTNKKTKVFRSDSNKELPPSFIGLY